MAGAALSDEMPILRMRQSSRTDIDLRRQIAPLLHSRRLRSCNTQPRQVAAGFDGCVVERVVATVVTARACHLRVEDCITTLPSRVARRSLDGTNIAAFSRTDYATTEA